MDPAAVLSRLAVATAARRQSMVSDGAAISPAASARVGICRRTREFRASSIPRRAMSDPPGLREARATWQRGDAVSAESQCRALLDSDPRNVGALILLGIVLRQRDPAAAENALRRAEQIDPGNADASFHLGNLYRETQRLVAAVEAYERALSLAPRHPSLLNN